MIPRTATRKAWRFWLPVAVAAMIVGFSWFTILRADGPYFVSTMGADTNDCRTMATACRSINAALGKTTAGDIVIVANGIYTESLVLQKNVTLIGFGPDATTISGGGTQRVMTVNASVTADVSNVTIAGGATGFPYYASGIFVSGTLRLSNSALTGNSFGGTIYNGGTFEGRALVITGNNAGGFDNYGAATLRESSIAENIQGIRNYGDFVLINSTVMSHTMSDFPGAGIANHGAMAINGSLIRANTINYADGGGIYNAGVLSISDSQVISNTAFGMSFPGPLGSEASLPAWGGGVFNGVLPYGVMTITNSALFGNNANYGGDQIKNGGSAYLVNATLSGDAGHHGIENGGAMTLTNVTISDMASGLLLSGTTAARNTILNSICFGAMTSLGHNLEGGNTCGFTAAGDLTNTNPLLGPLQDNGGPTPTYALLPGSPAINAGENAACPATDQRGVPRPQAGRCDIGAYEVVFPVGAYLPFVAR